MIIFAASSNMATHSNFSPDRTLAVYDMINFINTLENSPLKFNTKSIKDSLRWKSRANIT